MKHERPWVYLSSTWKDLVEHRKAAMDSIRKGDCECKGMEDYPALAEPAARFCPEDVARCDIYVGIFAHSYGSIPDGHDRSFTELEYREAQRLGIPSLIFVVDESHSWPDGHRDTSAAIEKLRQLKQELHKGHAPTTFTTPENLARKVAEALLRHLGSSRRPTIRENTLRRNPAAPPGISTHEWLDTLSFHSPDEIGYVIGLLQEDRPEARVLLLSGPTGSGETPLAPMRHLSCPAGRDAHCACDARTRRIRDVHTVAGGFRSLSKPEAWLG